MDAHALDPAVGGSGGPKEVVQRLRHLGAACTASASAQHRELYFTRDPCNAAGWGLSQCQKAAHIVVSPGRTRKASTVAKGSQQCGQGM